MRKALNSKIEMVRPNQEIEIFTGKMKINGESQQGRIYHQWIPSDQIKLSVSNFDGESIHLIGSKVQVVFDYNVFGEFFITSIREGQSKSVSGFLKSELKKLNNNSNDLVKNIDFNLVNLRPYFGNFFEFLPKKIIAGELEFISDECDLLIQSRFESDESKNLLTEFGGFLITHNGILNFKNSISSKRFKYYFRRLSTFLSFLNGRRCGPRFIKAKNDDNQIVFEDYTPYFCDQYKYVQSWMPFKLDNEFLKLWSSFMDQTKNDDDFERVDLVIHWYLEALNNSGFVNGSIILLQNSFEILFSWLVAEKRIISALGKTDKEKGWASNKIRSLFTHYGVPLNFPPEYMDVFNVYDLSNNEDFGYVFPQIRNAFVHYSEEKKNDLDKLKGNHWPLLNLGLFYFEILFLKMIGYGGIIRSRIMKSGYPAERQVSILEPFIEIKT